MSGDAANKPKPKETSLPDEDERRTEEAKRVVQDYANGLRELIKKLRKRVLRPLN